MAESTGQRMFHEDIFAEDHEKFSWKLLGRPANTLTNEVTNYNVPAGRCKDSSNSPSSEEDSLYKVDSNSLKRSFRKRGSSSASEGNIAEDTSSSLKLSQVSVPHERVMPSIYDDDARSGSPSGVYEKKDLAFQSSFKEDFNNLKNKGFGSSSLYVELEANRTFPNQDRDDCSKDRNSNQSSSAYGNLKKESKEKSKNYRSRSRSSSREILRLESKSRSASRERRNGGQNRSRDRPFDRYSKSKKSPSPGIRSRSPDSRKCSPSFHKRSRSPEIRKKTRSPDSLRRTRSPDRKRARSPDSRRKTRSPDTLRRTRSPDSRRRTRSPVSRKKSRSPVSRKKSRSPVFRKRSRSRDSRRSHSRDIHKRSRSKDTRRRSRSYERRRRSRRSSSRDKYQRRRYSRSRSHSRDRGSSSRRKPGYLPLSTSGGAMTPQMALQQTMAAMSAKAQAMTGIALPKYYNPAAVNPLKYAEQVQKRKLLWQTKETEDEQPKNTVWDKLTFDQDQDGKMTAKFRKLMGIKSEGAGDAPESEKESVLKKQADLFRDLDQQYEMARVTTHTQRGVGLGYSATTLYPPIQK